MLFPSNQRQQVQPEEIPNVSITQRVSPPVLWIYLLDPLAIVRISLKRTWKFLFPLHPLVPPSRPFLFPPSFPSYFFQRVSRHGIPATFAAHAGAREPRSTTRACCRICRTILSVTASNTPYRRARRLASRLEAAVIDVVAIAWIRNPTRRDRTRIIFVPFPDSRSRENVRTKVSLPEGEGIYVVRGNNNISAVRM